MNSALKKLPNSTLSAIAKLQAALKQYECKPSTGMHYDVQSKYVTWRFPDKYRSIEILHITDVQLGHVECRLHRVREYIEWVLDRDNRFVLFGGDMIDSTTVLSPGSPWENLFEPQRQVYQFCEMFAPLRHRILGYVGGNHERRGVRTFGDLGVAIAMLLQVPYSGGRQLIDIYLGAHKPFTIDLWHGSGTARTHIGEQREMGNERAMSVDTPLRDAQAVLKWARADLLQLHVAITKIEGMVRDVELLLDGQRDLPEVRRTEGNGEHVRMVPSMP